MAQIAVSADQIGPASVSKSPFKICVLFITITFYF